ncbi:MAG: DUF5696 domain-containing protein [bacterium]
MFWRSLLKKTVLIGLVVIAFFGTRTLFAQVWEVPADALPDLAYSIPLDDTLFTSNQYTQPDDLSLVIECPIDIPGSFVPVTETASLALWVEPATGAIRVVDKADGYIWGSSFAGADEDVPGIGSLLEKFINSALIIQYFEYNEGTGAYQIKEETIFTNAESVDLETRSTTTFQLVTDGFDFVVFFGLSGISLTLEVRLDEDRLIVRVPNDSIEESGEYLLKNVRAYSYFGAVYADSMPGYMFVPDGSGALVRYQPIDAFLTNLEFAYYGTDPGIINQTQTEAMLSFPITGMVQGIDQHAFVQIIAEGDPFATLVVATAKRFIPYAVSYHTFNYRSTYAAPTSKAAAAAGSGQQALQADLNSCEAEIVYRFLSGTDANYVGMANSYQDYLMAEGVLTPMTATSEQIPALIEILGAETKQGFIFDEIEVMTSFAATDRILAALDAEIGPLTVVLKGWNKGGLTKGGVNYSQHESSLGTARELAALIERYNDGTNALSLYADFVKVYENGAYNPYRDLSQRINSALLGFDGVTKRYYYLNPLRAQALFLDAMQALQSDGASLALGSVGYLLYSDYTDLEAELDRAEVRDIFLAMLAEAGEKQALYRPNAYMLAYADKYLIVPTATSNYGMYTDTVPFVAILLAGAMEAYGPYANFFANQNAEWLRFVDYGLYPSFILTEASAYQLQDTELASLYSSSFATWEEAVASGYGFVAGALDGVYGVGIVARTVLAPGVICIEYQNGVTIYVNYTHASVSAAGVTVEAGSYEVVNP